MLNKIDFDEMKKLIFLLVCFLSVLTSFSQTETAQAMYAEATAGKMTVNQYLKQDFASVDSVTMHDLAVLFYQANDYASAGTCWEIALGKVKKHGKAYEQIINCLYLVYEDNYEKLQWLLQIAEEHCQQELLKDCNDYKCKLERAQYYVTHGDEVKAKEHIKESIELCQTEEQRIEVEEAYAKILFQIRDFEGAAQYFHSVANRWKGLENIEKYGDAMYWSAQNYILSSKYDVAENHSRKAVEVSQNDTTAEGGKNYIKHLVCLGDALFCQQKNEEALEIYTVELEECKKILPNTEEHADALEDIGKVLVRLKQFDEAELHLQQACNMYKTLNLDSKYSNTYSELLICMRKSGNNDVADEMEQDADLKRKEVHQRILDSELKSLAITEKYLGSIVYTNSLNTIAGCYYGLDKYRDAAHYFELYTENLRKMLQEKFLLLTDVDRERIWSEHQQHIDDYRFNVAALPDSVTDLMSLYVPILYDMELISKGIMLNSVIEFEKVLERTGDIELLKIYNQVKANQQQIEELQSIVSDENLQKVLSLKQINTNLQRTLMTDCATYSDYTNYLSFTWRDVQAKLGVNDIAIEFTTVPLSPLDKDNYILALILTSTGEPTMELISTKAIIKNMVSKDDLYDNSQYYNLFWGFMQRHLIGKKRVYFAPDNNLSNIAVEYLLDGDLSFYEKYEVYRLSSTKELCRNYSEKSSQKTIAIFGNIDYNTQKTSTQRGSLSYGQLKYSKEEVENIDSAMRKVYKVSVYEKERATEQSFRKLSDNTPTILHVSSHGDYDGNDKTSNVDAMNNSYLALSGINNIFSTDIQNDGKITAADIAQMNLRQCDMAVLSACNTGLGGKGSDGIFGLQRGFKNAGVRSLLMSLKPVYDESTAKLMTAFYEGLSKGKSKRQSLLDAQNAIKAMGCKDDKNYKEGKYWAPFILLDGLK